MSRQLNQFQQYTNFVSYVLLLNIMLLFPSAHLLATQETPSHNEVTQSVENSVENKEQTNQEGKKPTFVESWRKVVTLQWKKLGKADALNIGAPLAGVAVLGLLYRCGLKDILANNNHNSGHNDPGTGLDDDSNTEFLDLSSDEDVGGDLDNVSFLTNANELLGDIQRKIALYRIEECLVKIAGKFNGVIQKLPKLQDAAEYDIEDETASLNDFQINSLKLCNYQQIMADISKDIQEDRMVATYDYLKKHAKIQRQFIRIQDKCKSILFANLWLKKFKNLGLESQLLLGEDEREKAYFPITWIYCNVTIPQADLICRTWNATIQNKTFTIYCLSEDGKVFLTLDKDVRMLLLKRLNIELNND